MGTISWGPASVSYEDGICVLEGQEKWMYGNCVQFLILVWGTSSPGNAHTCYHEMMCRVPVLPLYDLDLWPQAQLLIMEEYIRVRP
jgi:hypothetical protein